MDLNLKYKRDKEEKGVLELEHELNISHSSEPILDTSQLNAMRDNPSVNINYRQTVNPEGLSLAQELRKISEFYKELNKWKN